MSIQPRMQRIIGVIGIILVTMACALPFTSPQGSRPTETPTPGSLVTLVPFIGAATPTPTPTSTATPGLSTGGGTGGTGGNNGGTGGNGGGRGSNSGGNNGGTGGNNGGGESSTPTQLPDINSGPYVVKQIETLGGEVISGMVCNTAQPFSVLSNTPHVTFTFFFAPLDALHGKVSYAYSIPSAGESHDAAGTYSLSQVDKGGTLQLSLTVSDHVVFKGFDGNIPNHYKFNLVPSPGTPCQPAR
jgi:hypothetical protein